MAQNIGRRRGKSPIKTRIEMERKAENKNPGSRASFQKGLLNVADTALTFSAIGPTYKLGKGIVKGVGVAKKGFKKLKPSKGYKRVYRGEEPDSPYTFTMNAESLRGRYFFDNPADARYWSRQAGTRRGKVYSTDLPEKQFNIGKKITERRKGSKLPGELTIPKLYAGKKTLNKSQTFRANMEGLVDKIKSPFEFESGGLTKTVPPKRGPNPQGLKKGGTARGKGAAIRGTKFSGIY